ncbi:RNA recognition domain-containing protein (RRM)-containing protein [Kwoniella heveanensis CBS 569]|uniref:RNA recognition domain-containing protein (RRM)-containing protein n=1 Tax=Kwoniella heveanensis BCC8398 TaxID=1296120 RepID=A0A1B9GNQ4_9TREE|nr:RNA recognition domain-containing protein (RRM)-containing protein [Kwoniella heveanensis BCC8398]OCF38668.1 RNA recognition domain-containing protein (RRM)-containing protein [Kwoniella heveanensis CBS 569]
MSGQGGYNYTPEEQAAAWAAYYAQQGYTPDQIAAALGTPASSSASASASAYGYGPGSSLGHASASGSNTPIYGSAAPGAYQNVYDADLMQQSSVYDPNAAFAAAGGAGAQEASSSGKAKASKPVPGQKRQTVIRKGNGRTWEDPTLVDWDANWYRLFVGDVSNDVNERTLDEAFSKYPSYCKCKVVRDRLSLKAKYGFIAFKDPEDFLKAWKEMDGKYVGNRPIRLTKIKDDKYGSIETVTVGNRKAKVLDKLKKNHGKPLDGRPAPW